MPLALWDASALAKRYITETGTGAVNALFAQIPEANMVLPLLGYAETFSILLRCRNDGRLDAATFAIAVLALENETLNSPGFGLLSLTDTDVLNCLSLMRRHQLNSSDAVQLAALLRYRQSLPPGSPPCLLLAADQRLLRAARAEGLATLDPQQTAPAAIPAFLAALVPGDDGR